MLPLDSLTMALAAGLAAAPSSDPRIAGVVVHLRRADEVRWQKILRFAKQGEIVLPGAVADSHVLGVATVDARGHESVPAPPVKVQ